MEDCVAGVAGVSEDGGGGFGAARFFTDLGGVDLSEEAEDFGLTGLTGLTDPLPPLLAVATLLQLGVRPEVVLLEEAEVLPVEAEEAALPIMRDLTC